MDQDAVSTPPAARVPGNRWDLIGVPTLGAWQPTLPVTIVIPHYERPDALAVVLEALTVQTYPSHLLQVVVADDGSSRVPHLPSGLPFVAEVVQQERRGFGLARARNLGARRAEGQLLIFLDDDMVPEPSHVEAHARWHHVACDAVTLGFRRHVDPERFPPALLRDAARAGRLAQLFDGHPQQVPGWIETHMQRTASLTSAHNDLFRVVTGGNLALHRELFWEVGGFDESFDRWGGEDTELGYRLFTHGALLVPEREALCWHLGLWEEGPSAEERQSQDVQRARLAHLIPHPGFRREVPGRSYRVPRIVVSIDGSRAPRDQILACVEHVLSNSFHDLLVELRLALDHPDRDWLGFQLGWDPRVELLEPDDPPVAPHSPVRIELPAFAALGQETMRRVLDEIDGLQRNLGTLWITVPGVRPTEGLVVARRTRAWEKARRLSDGDPRRAAELVGELFGEWWASGFDYDIRALSRTGEVRDVGPLPGSLRPDELTQLRKLVEAVPAPDRVALIKVARRLVLMRTALTQVRHARGAVEFVHALRRVAAAVTPWRLKLLRRRVLALRDKRWRARR